MCILSEGVSWFLHRLSSTVTAWCAVRVNFFSIILTAWDSCYQTALSLQPRSSVFFILMCLQQTTGLQKKRTLIFFLSKVLKLYFLAKKIQSFPSSFHAKWDQTQIYQNQLYLKTSSTQMERNCSLLGS